MGASPRADAVIATYNAPPERLNRAIESCAASALVGRVIVVDDGSSPAAEVAGAWAGADRVVLIRQANAGPSAARNAGLERVRADFAVILDDDDALEPPGLEAMIELADRLGAVAAVAARYEALPGGERRFKPVPEGYRDAALPGPGEVFRPIAIFGASGCLVRRRAIEGGLRFDPSLQIGEDRDFLRRAAALGPIAVCGTAALTVTIHAGGANLSSAAHLKRRVRDHLVLVDRYCDAGSSGHMEAQTRWLLGTLAKGQGTGFDRDLWDKLAGAARARNWSIPLKTRLRAAIRRLRPDGTR